MSKMEALRLQMHTGDFRRFSSAMTVIAQMSPHRMTTSRVIFFVTAAASILSGKRPTYTEIRESIGDEVNRSLNTTYRVLFEPSRVYPKALQWLKRETNPHDNREQLFELTAQGRKVMQKVAEALAN